MKSKTFMLSLFIILVYFLFVKPVNLIIDTGKKPDLNTNDKVTVRG